MVHGCMEYTERAETAAVSRGTSHASAVSTPLGGHSKASHIRITCERSESDQEWRIALYKSVQQPWLLCQKYRIVAVRKVFYYCVCTRACHMLSLSLSFLCVCVCVHPSVLACVNECVHMCLCVHMPFSVVINWFLAIIVICLNTFLCVYDICLTFREGACTAATSHTWIIMHLIWTDLFYMLHWW